MSCAYLLRFVLFEFGSRSSMGIISCCAAWNYRPDPWTLPFRLISALVLLSQNHKSPRAGLSGRRCFYRTARLDLWIIKWCLNGVCGTSNKIAFLTFFIEIAFRSSSRVSIILCGLVRIQLSAGRIVEFRLSMSVVRRRLRFVSGRSVRVERVLQDNFYCGRNSLIWKLLLL